MPDATRRPGDALPPEDTRTGTPGPHGTPVGGPHADGDTRTGTPGLHGTPAGGPHADGDTRTGTPGVHGTPVGGHRTGEDARTVPGGSPAAATQPRGGTPDGDPARHGPGGGDTPGTAVGGAPAAGAGAHRDGAAVPASRLLPHDDGDELAARLHHAVAGFVDAPRDAVEEADHVLEELTARLTAAVTERRRALRRHWRTGGDDGGAAATDTEQLRLALRDYRELAERLLRV